MMIIIIIEVNSLRIQGINTEVTMKFTCYYLTTFLKPYILPEFFLTISSINEDLVLNFIQGFL